MSKIDRNLLIAIVIISSFLSLSLLKSGVFTSHDGEIHIARIAQSAQILKEKQISFRWLSNWNFAYGYPVFVYVYSLPYYFAALLSFFPLTYEAIFKILLYLSLVASAVTFFLSVRLKFSSLGAFVGSVFYISAPYRFADIYERGALGEALSFIFLPFLFFSPVILEKYQTFGRILTAFIVFILITTHSLTFLVFIVPTIIYSLLVFKSEAKMYLIFGCSIFLGLMLASFQWMPMVFEQKYVNLDHTYYNLYRGHLITPYQLLRIPQAGVNIGTGIQLGIAQSLVIIIALVYLVFKRSIFFFFLLLSVIIASYLTTTASAPIWEFVEPLQKLLFPWRFLTYTTFASALMAAYLASKSYNNYFKIPAIIILLIIAIVPSRHYLLGHNYQTHANEYYETYQDKNRLDNYFLPKTFNKNLQDFNLPNVSLISGGGRVDALDKKNNVGKYFAELSENSLLQFHTMYFPGWKLYIDNVKSKIISDRSNLEGLIIAEVPKGSHNLELKFTETSLRKAANLASLISSITLLGYVIYLKHWRRGKIL